MSQKAFLKPVRRWVGKIRSKGQPNIATSATTASNAPSSGSTVPAQQTGAVTSHTSNASVTDILNVASRKNLDNVWQQADQELCRDEKKKEIFDAYIKILEAKYGENLAARGSPEYQDQMKKLLDTKTEELGKIKWKSRAATASRTILHAKDLIDTAVSASPPAVIACAGVSVILKLLVDAGEQYSTLLEGLKTVCDSILRASAIVDLYRSSNHGVTRRDFLDQFEEKLIRYCSQILEYQARALCHMQRNQLAQIVRDMVKHDAWDDLVKGISKTEDSLMHDLQIINPAGTESMLKELGDKMSTIEQRIGNVLRLLEEDARRREDSVKLAQETARNKCLRILYDHTCRYKESKNRNITRVEGTCEWFVNHSRFLKFKAECKLLWVSADPGCGKSVLARYLIDDILPSSERTVCYFFFKDEFDNQRSSASAVCALLRQLLKKKPHLLTKSFIDKLDQDGKKLLQSFDDLWEIFIETAKNAGPVVCVLDALDECQDSDRSPLIKAVLDHQKASSNLKFLLTSRPYDDIRREFRPLKDRAPTIHLDGGDEIDKIMQEINLVIHSRVEEIGTELDLSADECEFLQEKLKTNPNRTYLWVSLMLDVIRRTPDFSRDNVCESIESIPHKVEEAYEHILSRIDGERKEKVKRLLYMIIGAERPLSLKEASVALAIKTKHRSYDDIEHNEERFKNSIGDISGLFVVIVNSKLYLLHQTAREFLLRKEPLCENDHAKEKDRWLHSLRLVDANRVLAETCILYISLIDFGRRSRDFDEYVAQFWTDHFRHAAIKSSDGLAASALRICQPESMKLRTLSLIYWRPIRDGRIDDPLIIASAFGLEAVAELLLNHGLKVAIGPASKDSALQNAAHEGHEGIARLLLTHKAVAQPKSDYNIDGALNSAVHQKHHSVARILIDHGANVNAKDYSGAPLLMYTAEIGDGTMARLLLESGADPNARNESGNTPLSRASVFACEDVLEALLEHGADANLEDPQGRAPLLKAVNIASPNVVWQLLMRGANVHCKDENGRTPLEIAQRYGSDEIITMLKEYGAEVAPNEKKTPELSSALAQAVANAFRQHSIDADAWAEAAATAFYEKEGQTQQLRRENWSKRNGLMN